MAESKKGKHADFLETRQRIKPSSEVKFKQSNPNGTVVESSASKQFWETVTSDQFQDVAEQEASSEEAPKYTDNPNTSTTPDFRDLMNQIEQNLGAQKSAEAIRDVLQPLSESIDPGIQDSTDGEDSVFTRTPNPAPEENSVSLKEMSLLISAVEKLIDRVERMSQPIIHVPAPIINITMPETKRIVTKAITRDQDNYVKEIKETIHDIPTSKPKIKIESKK